jgi:hypothetical protein
MSSATAGLVAMTDGLGVDVAVEAVGIPVTFAGRRHGLAVTSPSWLASL